MAVKYTPQQREAIDYNKSSVLVNAGAGSGKTAVLSARVVEHVLRGIPLESLVILTFTNAAAKEMKTRIRTRLLKVEDSSYAKRALEVLDDANIQTFDSYALTIVRTFGYLENLSHQVSIGDQAEMAIRKRKFVEAIFLEKYREKDVRFLNFVRRYEIKDDASLRSMIHDFYDALTMHDDFLELLDHYRNRDLHTTFNALFKSYENIAYSLIKAIESTLSQCLENLQFQESIDFINDFQKLLKPLFEVREYDELYSIIQQFEKFPTLNRVSNSLKKRDASDELEYLKSYREEVKKLFDNLKDNFVSKIKADHWKDFKASNEDYPIIIEMLERLHHLFYHWQIENEQLEYSSVARLALRLIKTQDRVKNTLKGRIYEIMVDEYQDTNRLQEAFIENLGAELVYTVGDIKQSIYRFRHAEPKLFMNRYHNYHKGLGHVVALNKNFRSRKKLLEDVNSVFESVMDETIGGVDYQDEQHLKFGNTVYEKAYDSRVNEGLEFALYDTLSVEEWLESKRLNESDMEIFYIAEDIKKKVGIIKVYDDELKTMRPSRYEDFAILVSVSKRFDDFRQIFDYLAVPLEIHKEESFIDYYDVDLYRNALRLLYALSDHHYYKIHAKHCFMSVVRSYAFDFSDDAIIRQTLAFPKNLNYFETTILPDFKDFFEAFIKFTKRALIEPVDTVFKDMVEHFRWSDALIKMPSTMQAQARLDYLMSKMTRFSESYKSLQDITEYFDRLIMEDLEVHFESKRGSNIDQVQLMTIHKSKGLEYPFVYIPHLKRKFNQSKIKTYAFDRRLGFILKFDDEGLKKSFIHDIYNHEQLIEDISERIRLLYVGLTRAKDACILPLLNENKHTYRFDSKGKVIDYDRIYQYHHYHDIIHSILNKFTTQHTEVELDRLPLSDAYKLRPQKAQIKEIDLPQKIYQTDDYELKAQTSTRFSSGVSEVLTKEQFKAIQRGNQLHEYFELIDFKKPLEPQIQAMKLEETSSQYIRAFFDSDVVKGLSIVEVYQEFPFAIEEDEASFTGFIDLLLECKDKWVIIDYKLKNIEKAHYIDQIKGYETILKKLTEKPVEGYLYSIIEQRFQKVV